MKTAIDRFFRLDSSRYKRDFPELKLLSQ